MAELTNGEINLKIQDGIAAFITAQKKSEETAKVASDAAAALLVAAAVVEKGKNREFLMQAFIALLGAVTTVLSAYLTLTMGRLEHNTNSLMTELNKKTAETSRAAGNIEGRAEQTDERERGVRKGK